MRAFRGERYVRYVRKRVTSAGTRHAASVESDSNEMATTYASAKSQPMQRLHGGLSRRVRAHFARTSANSAQPIIRRASGGLRKRAS